MQLEYDLNVGALYIRLSDQSVARTRSVDDNTAVDLDDEGRVVGIEVISIAHPWPIADILDGYDIPAAEEAQLRVYFPHAVAVLAPPQFSVASPAPAAMLTPAA
jgi:uncharacterized protein YuzE